MSAPPGKRPFVAGNWKMNLGPAAAAGLARELALRSAEVPGADLAVFPPFVSLAAVSAVLAGSPIGLGGQTLHWEDSGAFTGEVSGPMLKEAGCRFVLVGHSERRRLFGETDETVRLRLGAALRAGLRPVVCLGETLDERDAGKTLEVLRRQFEGAFRDLGGPGFRQALIAYEPVWAIGTGRTASAPQAGEAQAFLRGLAASAYGNEAAGCAIILYGGSVKPGHAYPLTLEKDVDGFLVGGASLEAESFLGIAREAARACEESK